MKVKITMKLGDDTLNATNEDMEMMGGGEQNMFQLMMFKTYMDMIVKELEKRDPNIRKKRVEIVTEFEDDGYYMVVGRKPTEEKYFGT